MGTKICFWSLVRRGLRDEKEEKRREEEGERKKFGVVTMIIIKDGRAQPSPVQLAQRSAVQLSKVQRTFRGYFTLASPINKYLYPHREITAIMTGGVRAKHGVALRNTCLRCT
ncbi:hypothetical protein FVEG_17341 [Fusarium verticillioides 7600]|uniref:Uncharacterized protein n=1 Tax=Gibberella moniliformis (strain M3125 / FGSC 7600) TaxID=334819 RepID=W7MT12_GIBM7|nr:hypothetical protein FVEG_17341 [Fusarium verticillioides 7600]EWG54593.1 hypothetical protein FVEG_17341 [Fusarium verticillioides 7600]